MTERQFTQDDLRAMELFTWSGQIHIINKDTQVEKALQHIKKQQLLSVDTETEPHFANFDLPKNQRIKRENDPGLLQIGTRSAVFLFQLNYIDRKHIIRTIFHECADILKIGAALNIDLKRLRGRIFNFKQNNSLNIQTYIKQQGFQKIGLANIIQNLLNYRFPKGATLSHWNREHLKEHQIKYAVNDVAVIFPLYDKMIEFGWLDNEWKTIEDPDLRYATTPITKQKYQIESQGVTGKDYTFDISEDEACWFGEAGCWKALPGDKWKNL